MNQENKELLLQYLCMSLPYEVKVVYFLNNTTCGKPFTLNQISTNFEVEEIRPYLRLFKDMTKEEKVELLNIIQKESDIVINNLKTNNCGILEGKYHFNSLLELQWCLKKHFDIMDLVPEGLAIVVTEENNPYKE